MKEIRGFFGPNRWLSNFWPAEVRLDGMTYPTVEHAYQAYKTTDLNQRLRILQAKTPGLAKKLGSQVALRPDWEVLKLDVMRRLVQRKFNDAELQKKLLATGEAELVEENYWNDTFWGVCRGVGENHLGKILMQVREEIQRSVGRGGSSASLSR